LSNIPALFPCFPGFNPKEIRKRLNIVAGKRLSLKGEGDRVLLTPLPDDPVEAFCGIFKEKSSLTRALTEHREKDKHREEKKIVG
jgi:bifunctional DNA-binding transcriptional regulator/antitoxin component of YhaV-PrlF toxin-antitoxin module